ncbi:MAG: hypothetical protein JWM93_522 [Frankiales bacterium]|nr:hypothetical protein [Frankiales bacterium]
MSVYPAIVAARRLTVQEDRRADQWTGLTCPAPVRVLAGVGAQHKRAVFQVSGPHVGANEAAGAPVHRKGRPCSPRFQTGCDLRSLGLSRYAG